MYRAISNAKDTDEQAEYPQNQMKDISDISEEAVCQKLDVDFEMPIIVTRNEIDLTGDTDDVSRIVTLQGLPDEEIQIRGGVREKKIMAHSSIENNSEFDVRNACGSISVTTNDIIESTGQELCSVSLFPPWCEPNQIINLEAICKQGVGPQKLDKNSATLEKVGETDLNGDYPIDLFISNVPIIPNTRAKVLPFRPQEIQEEILKPILPKFKCEVEKNGAIYALDKDEFHIRPQDTVKMIVYFPLERVSNSDVTCSVNSVCKTNSEANTELATLFAIRRGNTKDKNSISFVIKRSSVKIKTLKEKSGVKNLKFTLQLFYHNHPFFEVHNVYPVHKGCKGWCCI